MKSEKMLQESLPTFIPTMQQKQLTSQLLYHSSNLRQVSEQSGLPSVAALMISVGKLANTSGILSSDENIRIFLLDFPPLLKLISPLLV
jgi:hypothetical protein